MGASKLWRGRGHATRADVCVGNAEDIAEEEWALKLGIFPVCSLLLILFDSSSLLLLRRRRRGGSGVFQTDTCDIFMRARGFVMMSASPAASCIWHLAARVVRHAPTPAAGVRESSRSRQSAQQRSPAYDAARQRTSLRI